MVEDAVADHAPRRGDAVESPLAEITHRLIEALDVACVVIGEPVDGGRLRVRAGRASGRPLTGFEYPAGLAPCGQVLRDGSFEFSEGGTERFPDCPFACEAYYGLALRERGEPIGHLAVSDPGARDFTPADRTLVAAFAMAVEAELRREQAEREGAPIVRILSESLPGAAYSYTTAPDGSRVVHYLSPKATEILGTEGAEMLATGLEHGRALLHPEDREEFARAVEEALEHGTRFDLEHRMLTSSGDYRWFRSMSRGNRFDDGTVRWTGIFLDSHDSHVLEEQFRALAENFPGVVNSYWEYPDGHRELVYASRGLEELLGAERAASLGRDVDRFLEEMVHPDDLPALMEAGRVALQRGETLDHEYRVLAEGGREQWVRVISQGTPAEDGAVLWQGILIDATERREAELRGIEYRGALMAANEALHRAKRRAETEANQALALVATLSSRISECVAAMRDLSGGISRTGADPAGRERSVRELLEHAREASELLEAMEELAGARASVDALERAILIARRRIVQDPGSGES